MRIGILSNPKAGRNRKRAAQFHAFLRDQTAIVHIETDRYPRRQDALAVLAQHEVDIVAVYGGDGTLQRVLTEVLSTDVFPRLPFIAPLRGGRTNTGAAAIGSPSNPVRALAALLEAIEENTVCDRIVTRPVLRIDLGPNEPQGQIQYGLILGLGVIHRTTELKHRILPDKYFQGVLGSAAFMGYVALQAVLRSSNGVVQPDEMAISLDGQAILEGMDGHKQPYLFVVATTLDHFFLNLRPFWGQANAPIRFTAMTAGARRRLLSLIHIAQGKPPRAEGYVSRNVAKLELQLACGLFIDGELFAPKPNRCIRIEADQRIKFVRTD